MPDKGNLIWHPPFPDIIFFPLSYNSLTYVFMVSFRFNTCFSGKKLAFSPFYC